MLNPKYATKNKGSEYRCPLHISDKNLAIDSWWHVFWSDCFLVFYFISQLPGTGDFTREFLPLLSHLHGFSSMLPVSITKFACRILPPWVRPSRWKQGPSGLFLHTPSSLCPSDALCRAPALPRLLLTDPARGWPGPVPAPALAPSTEMVPRACSLQWEESKFGAPCFCRYCSKLLIISEGFRACWKIASFAVITSLLAQQLLRRLCYWSGYWVSATRMLCPLLRDQRI